MIYNSDEAWSEAENGETRAESIRYIPIFPHINKPAALASFSRMGTMGIFYHILTPIGCVLRFGFFSFAPPETIKTRARKSAVPQREDKGKVADEFCSACGSKLPKGAAFCVSCGKKAI